MLPDRAAIDDPGVAKFSLQLGQLVIGAADVGPLREAHLPRLQLRLQQVEQIGPADGIDQHDAIMDRALFGVLAVAIAADVKPNHLKWTRRAGPVAPAC